MEMKVVNPDTGDDFVLERTEDLGSDLAAFHSSICKHAIKHLCKAEISDGRVQLREQCSACGKLCGPAKKQNGPTAAVLDADPSIERNYQRDRQVRYDDIIRKHVRLQSEHDGEWWEKYSQYLLSATWSEKRKKVMARARGICEGCLEGAATQVHHKTYSHVFNEFMFELVALCDDCHNRMHPDGD